MEAIDTAEKFAQLLHDTYIQVAPQHAFGAKWEELHESERDLISKVFAQVFEDISLGVIGKPDGGEATHMLITASETHVRFDFGIKLRWMAMPKQEAIQFAINILQRCGIQVNVTLPPLPQTDSGGPVQ